LTAEFPPALQEVSIPGCVLADQNHGCSWQVFKTTIEHAIDPEFVSLEAGGKANAGHL